jgi:pentapeptide repeat protein
MATVVAILLVGCGGSDTQTVNGCDIESGTQCANIDLSGADLEGADLSRAGLSGTNLEGTNLSGANLREADLTDAKLVNTNLEDADLTSANLTGATITDTDLDGATLCGTTRTDGTTDDTDCEASTDTTETTEDAEATVTSFDLSELDCGSAMTGPVTVTWETENATAVEIAVDTASPTSGGPSGSTTVVVACDGNPHAITITPRSDSGPGVPDTKEVSSD